MDLTKIDLVKLRAINKQLEKSKEIIGIERDKLEKYIDELDEFRSTFEYAYDYLEDAIRELSKKLQ